MKNKIIPFPKERIKEPKIIPGDNKIIYLRREYFQKGKCQS